MAMTLRSVVARAMQLSPPTVHEMVRRLEREIMAVCVRQAGMPRKDFMDASEQDQAMDSCVDPRPSIDEQMESEESAAAILRMLSPEALKVFCIVQDPPPEVRKEYQAWQGKAKTISGRERPPKTRVPVSFVCRVLMPRLYGISEGRGRRIETEISHILQYAHAL